MKRNLLTLVLVFGLTTLFLGHAEAKRVVVPKMYMFGFAASFNDTIVHFTDVVEVDSVWIESKNNFLLGRNMYSHQFKEYLNTTLNMPMRTCVTVYARNRAKAEKKLLKMKKLYTKSKDGQSHFDVRHIDAGTFHYKTIDISQFDSNEEESEEATKVKKDKKNKKRKSQINKLQGGE